MHADAFEWLNISAEQAARRLLGCELVRTIDGQEIRVRIVETEAYDQEDEASHAFRGRTARNDVMFRRAGHLYVYFTYGMHYCCNVVCGAEGYGSGALIRAVEPLCGFDYLELNRGVSGVNVTNGPAKLTQALSVDMTLNGHDLATPPLQLIEQPALADSMVVAAPRIGISKAADALRRFYIADSTYVSRK